MTSCIENILTIYTYASIKLQNLAFLDPTLAQRSPKYYLNRPVWADDPHNCIWNAKLTTEHASYDPSTVLLIVRPFISWPLWPDLASATLLSRLWHHETIICRFFSIISFLTPTKNIYLKTYTRWKRWSLIWPVTSSVALSSMNLVHVMTPHFPSGLMILMLFEYVKSAP